MKKKFRKGTTQYLEFVNPQEGFRKTEGFIKILLQRNSLKIGAKTCIPPNQAYFKIKNQVHKNDYKYNTKNQTNKKFNDF
ncbi:hypothetical protein DDT91_20700 [Algoriphagus sp. AK58]|nr:hypothetical protein [Algoriphagus sp. AK58]